MLYIKNIFKARKKLASIKLNIFLSCKSSHPEVFSQKGVFKNFAKFTQKHLYLSLFFHKITELRPATLLKKRLWHRYFLVISAKFLKTPFFIEHLREYFCPCFSVYCFSKMKSFSI